ncbi:MAG TPA: multicopper oxidase domain-containing protein [Candidatus Didemnitutus sp.]|nr:multicopper oxidase domain-containing protein [Candidatus Didemnitutus sp.]
MAFNRRKFLKTVAAGAAVGSIQTFGFSRASAFSDVNIANRMKMPGTYAGDTLSLRQGSANIYTDHVSSVLMFGSYLSPIVRANRGDIQSVKILNNYTSPVAVHWHGLDVPSDMDGHPKDAFAPGTSKEYSFRVLNRAGTYFYHSHSHMSTGPEVNKGLVGLFIVHDDEERALGLPSGERDVPILIQDVRFDSSQQIVYTPMAVDMVQGWLGNVVLANGTPKAYHELTPTYHRLRLVNGSNARIYNLRLSDNSDMVVIGGDGGLLEVPETASSIMLAPGERADVLVDFSRYNSGSTVTLLSGAFNAPGGGHMGDSQYPQGVAYNVVEFRIVGQNDNTFVLPTVLSTIPPLPPLTGITKRKFDLQMSMAGGMKHTINGNTFEMLRTDFTLAAGTTEVWEIRNMETDMFHPIHVHGPQFRVVSRTNGQLAPHEKAYKDTILVHPSETVRILVTASSYLGLSLIHCHNLEHEDDGMMLNIMVSAATGVLDDDHVEIEMYPQPTSDSIIIRHNKKGKQNIELSDIHGRAVLSTSINEGETRISLTNLANGTYVARIGSFAKTIILQR